MPCTREEFYKTVRSNEVKSLIARARQALAEGRQKDYDQLKRGLPGFIFMATFDQNQGKNGTNPPAAWRLQSAARLNGLVMLDFDHMKEPPREVFRRLAPQMLDDTSPNAILLAHVTPSGQGLRLVCSADAQRGNLADNQQYISRCLGLECDKAVKNADRLSFAVSEEDILYINDLIFTWNDEEYNEKFGHLYRGNNSNPTHHAAGSGAGSNGQADNHVGGNNATHGPAGVETTLKQNEEGEYVFGNVTYRAIVEAWLKKNGQPQVGVRHQALLRMAGDLRYVCDNSPQNLKLVVRLAPFVCDMDKEGAKAEVDAVCDDVCQRKSWLSMPQRMGQVLQMAGAKNGPGSDDDGPDLSLYTMFWKRLEPLICPPYDVACFGVDNENKLGAVFVAGTMFCTLMTRCWYEHFDGQSHRMNPQAYIIGDPASGKSFADRLDRNIMGAMRAADRPAREAEAEYKRAQKERSTSSKAQKGDALKRPEGVIRYLPSRTSNAVFYRRQLNAKEEQGGEVTPLHLYTFDSELDANNVAQSSGAWIGKHDLELKAFHNEWTGVDYANGDSVNDIIQVFYNTVVTGTPISLTRKINLRNVNDGLCSRIAIFRMLPTRYKMVERGSQLRNHEVECQLKQWGFNFDGMSGELPLKPLVDHVYSLCEMSAFEAEASDDRVLDYLRKRAVFYAIWLTVPRIYGRQWDKYKETGEISINDDDLRFATLIYDAVIYWQDHFFGSMLQESWNNAAQEYQPRRRTSRNSQAYNALPETFSSAQCASALAVSAQAAAMQVSRWKKAGYVEATGKGQFKKIVSQLV